MLFHTTHWNSLLTGKFKGINPARNLVRVNDLIQMVTDTVIHWTFMVSCMRRGVLTLSGAPSTTSHFGYTSFHLDYNILYNLHCLGSPLGYCTLIFDLMRNLYIYNACIYIYSILLTGWMALLVDRFCPRGYS